MAFITLFQSETEAEETARLAEHDPTSLLGRLASAPVNIERIGHGQIIELPREHTAPGRGLRTVVVPIELRLSPHTYEPGEKRRRNHSWHCVVVASNDDRYPVGGHDLSINEVELRRGRLLEV